MKFTLSWLKEHLETQATVDAIAERLTAIGLEIESVDKPAERLGAFTVAHVVSAEQHPNADKLKLCQVDTGSGELTQVVCGAPNARAGMKAVFAPSGTRIPGTGLLLKPGKIRGEESNGMLCSERELELSDEHNGIIELGDEAPIGARYIDYADLDDPLFEIGLTPNRGDAAGVRGIARDLAAAGLGKLKPNRTLYSGERTAYAGPGVSLETPDAPAFAWCIVRGVQNEASPRWLQDKLRAVGQKPISALVDLTNFLTLDQCRPAHVFDLAKLSGDLHVRKAESGESFEALNDKTYKLDTDMTVIADAQGVRSLAGIMGGKDSGCDETTRDVLVELALWNPSDIARTGRRLQILSDARYRFERGVDPANLVEQMDLITALIVELCGGTPSATQLEGKVPTWQRSLDLKWSLTAQRSGLEVPKERASQILVQLGFQVEDQGDFARVQPPSWRPDIDLAEDLTEEILRIEGLDRLPASDLPPRTALPTPALSANQARMGRAKRALAAQRGMLEAYLWSFTSSRVAANFGVPLSDELYLENPIKSDLDLMRPSLLPNLLLAAKRNQDRGFGDLALFEAGLRFLDVKADAQHPTLAGLRAGLFSPRHWTGEQREVDPFDAKADALAALQAYGAPAANLKTRAIEAETHPYLHPGQAAELVLGKQALAVFGALHPTLLEELDLRAPVVLFEIYLDKVPEPRAKAGFAKPLLQPSPLQPVTKDFAFLVKEEVAAETLIQAIRGADKKLIAEVGLFDVYLGAGVPEGHKSLALVVTLQPREASLTDEDLQSLSEKIIAAALKSSGAQLRS